MDFNFFSLYRLLPLVGLACLVSAAACKNRESYVKGQTRVPLMVGILGGLVIVVNTLWGGQTGGELGARAYAVLVALPWLLLPAWPTVLLVLGHRRDASNAFLVVGMLNLLAFPAILATGLMYYSFP